MKILNRLLKEKRYQIAPWKKNLADSLSNETGNPNYKTKDFLNDEIINSIMTSNTIYLLKVESKIQTLLSF